MFIGYIKLPKHSDDTIPKYHCKTMVVMLCEAISGRWCIYICVWLSDIRKVVYICVWLSDVESGRWCIYACDCQIIRHELLDVTWLYARLHLGGEKILRH